MSTPEATPPTLVRRFVPLGLIVVGVLMLVALTASLLFPPGPPAWPVPWGLIADAGPPTLAPAATVIQVRTQWWPACHPYDQNIGNVANSSWLTQDIVYTPSSVTITLRVRHVVPAVKCEGFYDYWGTPMEVRLSEPLAGRALFDGSSDPAGARPYH